MKNDTKTLLERRAKAVPRGVFNVTGYFADKADGAVITDVEGREIIDFAGGIGVMNAGHCNPRVVEAIEQQCRKNIHTCFHICMYEEYVALAEKLIEITPGSFEKRAALFNSGAEAVENAVKIARHATGRSGVIAFDMGFHGRTLLTMSLTAKVMPYKAGFGPFAPEVHRMPYAYCYRCPLGKDYPSCGVACAEKLNDFFINYAEAADVACLIVEPITGEGGFVTPPPEYFPRLKAICDEHGIVFIADEVQTGAGRTGAMYAMEHWGVEPDLVTTAKSLGGGMPISAVVGRAELMEHPQVGGIGGTYGGNPVSCAAALAAIDALEQDGLLERGRELGARLRDCFDVWSGKYPIIGEVRGKGPMLALELVADRKTRAPATALAKELVARCVKRGLIILACGNHGNVIRTLMPLVITDEQLERGLAILEEELAAISESL